MYILVRFSTPTWQMQRELAKRRLKKMKLELRWKLSFITLLPRSLSHGWVQDDSSFELGGFVISLSAALVAVGYGNNKVVSYTNALVFCSYSGMACCQVNQSATTLPQFTWPTIKNLQQERLTTVLRTKSRW